MNAARHDDLQRFLQREGWSQAELQPLAGDASFRRYVRLVNGDNRAMLMDAPPEKENVRPYVAVAKHLHSLGYSAPEILAEEKEQGFLLLEDLGDDLFTPLMNASRLEEKKLYELALDTLIEWHREPALQKIESSIQLPDYSTDLLLQEVALFVDWFLPAVAGREKAASLRNEFLGLWMKLLKDNPLATSHFVHRDYHASNLMWLPEREHFKRVGLLDFQDAVWGNSAYDVVSLLEDARRDVNPDLANTMLARYITVTKQDAKQFCRHYAVLGAQRNCKIIGIFVRLHARDGKRNYLPLLHRVWKYLEQDLMHPALAPLERWINQHIPREWRSMPGAV